MAFLGAMMLAHRRRHTDIGGRRLLTSVPPVTARNDPHLWGLTVRPVQAHLGPYEKLCIRTDCCLPQGPDPPVSRFWTSAKAALNGIGYWVKDREGRATQILKKRSGNSGPGSADRPV